MTGSDDIYISVGNRGSWTSSLVAKNRNASYIWLWLSTQTMIFTLAATTSEVNLVTVAIKIWNISPIQAVVGCELP